MIQPQPANSPAKLLGARIAEFFDVTEAGQPMPWRDILSFCIDRETEGKLELLTQQFNAFQEYKTLSGEFPGYYKNYINAGSDPQYGSWNRQVWSRTLANYKANKPGPKPTPHGTSFTNRPASAKAQQQRELSKPNDGGSAGGW